MNPADVPDDLDALRSTLLAASRRLTDSRDDAEDLVQETLAVLLHRREEIRSPERVVAWCRAVMRNLYRQRLRRRWFTDVAAVDDLPDDPWPAVNARIALDAALERIPDRQRHVLRDFYLVGLTIATIARTEDRPEGTIKRWLHEGREALKMALKEPAKDAPLARIYCSNWLDDARRNVIDAVTKGGYRPLVADDLEGDALPTDAALYVFGEQVGARSGLEMLLVTRVTKETAKTPVLLFGPSRQTAVHAAWQAGANCYLTNPSSPEVADFIAKLRAAEALGASKA